MKTVWHGQEDCQFKASCKTQSQKRGGSKGSLVEHFANMCVPNTLYSPGVPVFSQLYNYSIPEPFQDNFLLLRKKILTFQFFDTGVPEAEASLEPPVQLKTISNV